jgi:hypothetical protein
MLTVPRSGPALAGCLKKHGVIPGRPSGGRDDDIHAFTAGRYTPRAGIAQGDSVTAIEIFAPNAENASGRGAIHSLKDR